ncbi:trans-4-hydroxy-L-proline dehydratase [candidate division KSB1 bacterium]
MNNRIRKLREQSINAVPEISSERAVLITEFYKSDMSMSMSAPVKRAMAFKHILENETIYIGDGELIVGERGPFPKAVSTYPELTAHSIRDLDILNSREKVSFKVDDSTKEIYKKQVIPFWKGKTVREKIFKALPKEWKTAFKAGVFTEFMEQRAPGHTVLDDKIYKKGMLDFKKDIKYSIKELDFLNDPYAYDKREQLMAMDITADTLIDFAKRYAAKAKEMAKNTKNRKVKDELIEISRICSSVPANAPKTFREAIQYYWFVHLGVITELNPWDAFNPGKLDQHLFPFYEKDIADKKLSKDEAKELLQAIWIKFNNQPSPPKVGVTAEESATYTDFVQINSGGVKADGSDAVNELSYMILDVIAEMKLVQPNPSVQISKKTPESFLNKTLDVVKLGYGQPAIFNTDAVVQEMINQGKSVEDARNGGTSGCVETGAFGKENYNLSGYFNLVKVLEITLNNGIDPVSGKKTGLKTGDPAKFRNFEELFNAFKKQLEYFIDIKNTGNNIIERIYSEFMPVPFLSLLIDDCIKKGKDYHSGGARYNTTYIQGVGVGTLTNSLSSLKYHVFDKKNISMKKMISTLKTDFRKNRDIQNLFINKTPNYGNDDDYADSIMKDIFETFYKTVNGRKNTKGGYYAINLLPTTVHIYFGSVINATPDGRNAGEPLSEGISPVQGSDRNGPTAVIKSVSKMDHIRTGGTLLNMKFSPQILNDNTGKDKVAKLIRSYFKMDGHHIQLNVVNAEILREAQKNPAKHRDLIVRVAGYSDYFVDLGKKLQDEIISRTEHIEF